MYQLVANQVRISSMGEVIGLDYGVVLDVIKVYFEGEDVKKTFNGVLMCYRIEKEARKENE